MALVAAGGPGDQGHLVGDDEGAVEADAELADQLRRHDALLACGAHGLQESRGPALGDGPDILHDLIIGHADAVIGDLQGPLLLVRGDLDLQFRIVAQQFRFRLGLETELVDGVRGVGDEFPQEDLPVGIERVDDDVHELLDFGLELMGFLLSFHDASRSYDLTYSDDCIRVAGAAL